MLRQFPSHPHVRRWATRLLLALVLLASIPAHAPTLQAQTSENSTVTWGSVVNTTNTSTRSLFPSIVVDSNQHSHILYNIVDANGNGTLWYINNVSGSFGSPQEVDKDLGTNSNPFFAMAIGPNNVLHIAYPKNGSDQQVYYRQGTLNGASVSWSGTQKISNSPSGTKSFSVFLTVDGSGNAHIVWIDNRCGSTYNVFYRLRRADGGLGDETPVDPNCNTYENHPEIVVTSDGKPHVIYQHESEIYYARLDSNGWQRQNISNTSTNSLNPTIATDGQAIYVAWDEGVNNHDILFRRSQDGGQNWSNTVDFSGDGSSYASFPSATWSASAQRVYIAWADSINSTSGQTNIWFREFDPSSGNTTAAQQLTNTSQLSSLPSVATGPAWAAIAWQGKETGQYQIYHIAGPTTGSPTPTPTPTPGSGCTGSLVLEDGATMVKKQTVTGVIAPLGCTPATMQVSVDTPPDANTPKTNYTSTITVQIPDGGCTHTVYVQLYDSQGQTGAVLHASIDVATTVEAAVQALNPHQANLPTIYTPATNATSAQTADATTAGADDGAPTYTRDRVFFLSVADNGDCGDLTNFSVQGSVSASIPSTGFANALPLPGDSSPGVKNFTVVVTDTLANTRSTTFTMVYDPPDTNPSSTVTNTAGLPVLADGGSVSADSANSVFRILSFSNISVTDNLYGKQGENLPAGRQFWGVWIANSRQDNDQDNANLSWFAVRVPTPNASFTVGWDLFNGLNYGSDSTKTGDYFVYVRFLDGAGNPSTNFLKAKVTLQTGYTLARISLPMISR